MAIYQVCVYILGPPAHMFLLEATHPLSVGGFDFPLRIHVNLQRAPIPSRGHCARPPPQGTVAAAQLIQIYMLEYTTTLRRIHLLFPIRAGQ